MSIRTPYRRWYQVNVNLDKLDGEYILVLIVIHIQSFTRALFMRSLPSGTISPISDTSLGDGRVFPEVKSETTPELSPTSSTSTLRRNSPLSPSTEARELCRDSLKIKFVIFKTFVQSFIDRAYYFSLFPRIHFRKFQYQSSTSPNLGFLEVIMG